MSIVYIRHADKAWKNGGSDVFSHDPPITSDGKRRCEKTTHDLLERCGFPVRVIISPYRRCRETAKELLEGVPNPPPLEVDTRLSEYLGHHQKMDVCPETIQHNPPFPEKFYQFVTRIRDFENSLNVKEGEVVWVITHGIVMKQIYKYLFGMVPSFNFLDFFVHYP